MDFIWHARLLRRCSSSLTKPGQSETSIVRLNRPAEPRSCELWLQISDIFDGEKASKAIKCI